MTAQLWTAALRGQRLRGTRLADLRAHFETGITAAAIVEPLKSCSPDASAVEIADLLAARDFDVAGVQKDEDTPVSAYVRREDLVLGGTVRDYIQPLTPELLIADSTPLVELLSVLAARPVVFVMMGREVRGVVTRWDLNKPPVRIFLFGMLALFEMHIGFWVCRAFGEDGWMDLLPPRSVARAQEFHARRVREEHESRLFDCLSLSDKCRLIRQSPEALASLGLDSPGSKQFDEVRRLRNSLAHASDDLAAGRSWSQISRTVAWVENALRASDEEIGRLARAAGAFVDDVLWDCV